jgi:response regulator RpfG family c-di-GMP phosphodiesterase
MSARILFVDDEPNVLAAYQRSLRNKFVLATATSGDQALGLIDSEGPFAVLVADMQMPLMNGIQFLRKAQQKAPDSVRLMLTGNADQRTAIEAVNHGHVFSFLTKPCPPESLETALENAVKQYRLVMAEKELLEQTLNGSVKLLTDILSMVDARGFGRAQRLRDEIRSVAAWFNAPRPWELELGAMLSHIGYVAIPGSVLEKFREGSALSGVEKDMLSRAPQIGADLLANIPRLQAVAEIVRYQQKNFDGSGSPIDSVAGEQIPIGARILRVLADLLAAETERKSRLQAFQELQAMPGRYDPRVLEAVAACFDIYLEKGSESSSAIGFNDLAVGDVLQADLRTMDGTLLVTKGNKISPLLIQKLRNFAELSGIQEPIYIQRAAAA